MIERIEVSAVGPDVALQSWASELPPQNATLTIVRVFDEDGTEGIGATPSYSTGRFDRAVLESLRLIAPRVPMLTDAQAYVEFVAEMRAQGFRAVKFHAWCEPERDLEMLRAVHAAHGDAGIAFMHDGEQRYDRRSAALVGRELDAMGFAWLEAPLVDLDLDGYRDLRRQVGVPILPGGNTILEVQQVGQALRMAPWDAVRFDVTIAGGFTAARKLAGLADAWGLRVELQSWGYTLIQAANLHFGLAHEHSGYFELPVPHEPYEYGVENPYRIQPDGYVDAPTAPGLGVVVDWERMDAARLSSFACTARNPEPSEEI